MARQWERHLLRFGRFPARSARHRITGWQPYADSRPDDLRLYGFAYLEDILDQQNRVSFIAGTSHDDFQIPQAAGQQPGLGLTVLGQTMFPSEKINENQREITHFGIASFQHAETAWDVQSSFVARYSSLYFSPDAIPDILYNGISQVALKRNTAFGFQTDSAFRLIDGHTVRAGFYIQADRSTSNTNSQVLPVDENWNQTTDQPITIIDNSAKTEKIYSVYVQDEWRIFPGLHPELRRPLRRL